MVLKENTLYCYEDADEKTLVTTLENVDQHEFHLKSGKKERMKERNDTSNAIAWQAKKRPKY